MIAVPVTESSQVAEARRRALGVAEGIGFDETDAGRVALIATELSTNLVKYGTSGALLIGLFEDPTGSGVEIVAVDKGAGMGDPLESQRDGHSTGGSPGTGLGAVKRQSHLFRLLSWPGLGTAVLSRVQKGRPTPLSHAPKVEQPDAPWGAIVVPMTGEEACGDAYCARTIGAGRTIFVADGLGHGPDAARAAHEAVRLFRQHESAPPAAILAAVHAGLRATRGAAVLVTRLDFERGVAVFAGLGNVAGCVVAGGQARRMVSLAGTAGHVARRIQEFEYPFPPDALLVMHSDGLGSNWALDRYPGLPGAHPTLVAAILYRDFARGRDDACVLVASGSAGMAAS